MRTKILTLGSTCLLMMGCILSTEEKIQINFWQKLFTEPFETVYIIMKDGMPIKHTNHYRGKVYMSMGMLEETLKAKDKNYGIKDIAIVIHNHLKDCVFSSRDREQYRSLKKYGFNGLFLLYCHRTNETYCLNEGDEKKGRSCQLSCFVGIFKPGFCRPSRLPPEICPSLSIREVEFVALRRP